MGTNPSYTTEDYAKRIVDYLKENGKATTEKIMKEITGTNFRLIDGLFLLHERGDIVSTVTKYKITWELYSS